MKKLMILFAVTLAFSAPISSFASEDRSIEATLEKIEAEKNAKCEYKKSSIGFRVMLYRWYKNFYTCVGNEGSFDIALKIRETGTYDQWGDIVFIKSEVKKVIYF